MVHYKAYSKKLERNQQCTKIHLDIQLDRCSVCHRIGRIVQRYYLGHTMELRLEEQKVPRLEVQLVDWLGRLMGRWLEYQKVQW